VRQALLLIEVQKRNRDQGQADGENKTNNVIAEGPEALSDESCLGCPSTAQREGDAHSSTKHLLSIGCKATPTRKAEEEKEASEYNGSGPTLPGDVTPDESKESNSALTELKGVEEEVGQSQRTLTCETG
jgi:hypothetical protein